VSRCGQLARINQIWFPNHVNGASFQGSANQ
jgi:hypothetical protein